MKGFAALIGTLLTFAVIGGGFAAIRYQTTHQGYGAIGSAEIALASPSDMSSASPTPATMDALDAQALPPAPTIDTVPTPVAGPDPAAGSASSTAAPGQNSIVSNPKEVVIGQPAHPNAPVGTDVFVAQGTYEAKAGAPVTIAANFQGGFPNTPIQFSWSGCPEVAGKNGQTITVTFANPGTYDVWVTATQVYQGYTFPFKSSVASRLVVS